jgi:hypothetical protein
LHFAGNQIRGWSWHISENVEKSFSVFLDERDGQWSGGAFIDVSGFTGSSSTSFWDHGTFVHFVGKSFLAGDGYDSQGAEKSHFGGFLVF